MSKALDADALAQFVDHTLLKPEATTADVDALISEAVTLGVWSVCVSPSFLPLDRAALGPVKVTTVVGFPSGKHTSEVKAFETAQAVAAGADEIDMVINIGDAKARNFAAVQADIAAVRAAAVADDRSIVLKVIIESAALSDHEIIEVCRAAEAAGADFVKTSTGFHPAGGATVEAVSTMHATVGGRLGVKASGGIRTTAAALALIEAGATRLGLSGTAAVLSGLESTSDY